MLLDEQGSTTTPIIELGTFKGHLKIASGQVDFRYNGPEDQWYRIKGSEILTENDITPDTDNPGYALNASNASNASNATNATHAQVAELAYFASDAGSAMNASQAVRSECDIDGNTITTTYATKNEVQNEINNAIGNVLTAEEF